MNRPRTLLITALAALLLLDVVTTTQALSLGFAEANPLLQTIASMPALHTALKLSFAGVVAVLAGLTDRIHPAGGDCVVCSAVAFYCLPAASNLYQMGGIV